jgi:hypothetical protein
MDPGICQTSSASPAEPGVSLGSQRKGVIENGIIQQGWK